MKSRSFLEGAGIAILILIGYLWPVLSPYHVAVYHDFGSASANATGLAIDLVILTIICAAILSALARWKSQKASIGWAVIGGYVAVTCLGLALLFLNFLGRHGMPAIRIPWPPSLQIALVCGFACAAVAVAKFYPAKFGIGVRLMRTGLAIFGCCIVWMLPTLVTVAIRTHTSDATQHAFHRLIPPRSAPHARVIWVLFDELSYDQVYQDRQPGLALPQFSELKKGSVVFSDVEPEGFYTERILPALLLDLRVNNIRSSLGGDLYVHEVNPSRWKTFSADETIFAKAKQMGWTTGVAGWFNPYCHILRGVLDSCYWQSRFSDKVVPTILGSPLLTEAAAPFYPFFSDIGAFSFPKDILGQNHIKDYRDLTAASQSLIEDEDIDFVFLHLPIPHPPAIYDRKTGELKLGGSYLDNVALADKTMGDILSTIQRTKAADRTTLIVSSDHSWRVPMWRTGTGWTTEDERASGGKFDERPFLLIRFPKESQGEVRSEKFPELETDSILSALLSGKIQSRGELNEWLQHQEATQQNIATGS